MDVLQTTADTGQCHNPYFRQEQLKSLHDILRTNVDDIKASLVQDSGITDVEASTEIARALSLVKQHYNSLEPAKELEQEYLIAKGKDAANRREPWGVVYIDPDLSHTPLFSVIAPLSAALVAGNCVALKIENSRRALPALLRQLLPGAISFDTFALVSSVPQANTLKNAIQVLQQENNEHPEYRQLVSQKRRVIAVVDRSADLSAAAESLVNARFAFAGTSSYAPDLILVNEFVKKEFLELVLRHAIRFLAGSGDIATNDSTSEKQTHNANTDKSLQKLSENARWKLSTITKGERGAVVELTKVSDTRLPLPSKITEPMFCISAITSLDHAIDLVAAGASPETQLLAAYHFAATTHAKYLGQFIEADATFVNHVPSALLLGPAAPAFSALDIEKRYHPSLFTRMSPQFIAQPSTPTSSLFTRKDGAKRAAQLLQDATKEIKVAKRPEWIAHGFFEQGIFIGLGMYGIPLLTCLGASVYFLARAAVRRFL
ncbi:Aldehyde/histidinol dehydrogenase [Lophiotrema nucula]|uniref:Aldehyde/histidinol dehydrogenase n=1 Tax=Lophiotrema nucula TaxID=690887 RepID=A0A6A5Z5R7_9PLEO|nr:Aldehyde/histidinol dehydrogenase [Lophiotrema nucula]